MGLSEIVREFRIRIFALKIQNLKSFKTRCERGTSSNFCRVSFVALEGCYLLLLFFLSRVSRRSPRFSSGRSFFHYHRETSCVLHTLLLMRTMSCSLPERCSAKTAI